MVKRDTMWIICWRAVVEIGGRSVECCLLLRSAVRSWSAAMMVSSRVAAGMTQLCGNHRIVCAILGFDGGWIPDVVAPVIFHFRANIVAIDGMGRPRGAVFGTEVG